MTVLVLSYWTSLETALNTSLKTGISYVPPGHVLGRTYRKGIVKPTLIFQPSEAAGK